MVEQERSPEAKPKGLLQILKSRFFSSPSSIATSVSFFLGLLWTSLQFVVIPSACSKALAFFEDAYALDITVGNWTGNVLDLSATAHDISVGVNGLFDHDEILTIDELKVELSFWRRLRHGTWTKEVTVRSPRLYLERQLSGGTNWSQLGQFLPPADAFREALDPDSSKEKEKSETDHAFAVPRIRVEGLTIESVEKLPGSSGGGLIHEQKSILFIDDIGFVATDMVGLYDGRKLPSNIQLEGRMADGKVSLQAKANFFSWSKPEHPSPAQDGLGETDSGVVWSPSLKGSIYLENIGAATLARLIPQAAIQPQRGGLTGKVDFNLSHQNLDCQANIQLFQFAYAVNANAPILKRHRGEVENALSTFQANERYLYDCGGNLNDQEFRPMQSFQARATRQAVDSAPKIVQATATLDEARYAQTEVEPELAGLVSTLARNDPNQDFYGLSPADLDNISSLTRAAGSLNGLRRTFRRLTRH